MAPSKINRKRLADVDLNSSEAKKFCDLEELMSQDNLQSARNLFDGDEPETEQMPELEDVNDSQSILQDQDNEEAEEEDDEEDSISLILKNKILCQQLKSHYAATLGIETKSLAVSRTMVQEAISRKVGFVMDFLRKKHNASLERVKKNKKAESEENNLKFKKKLKEKLLNPEEVKKADFDLSNSNKKNREDFNVQVSDNLVVGIGKAEGTSKKSNKYYSYDTYFINQYGFGAIDEKGIKEPSFSMQIPLRAIGPVIRGLDLCMVHYEKCPSVLKQ